MLASVSLDVDSSSDVVGELEKELSEIHLISKSSSVTAVGWSGLSV